MELLTLFVVYSNRKIDLEKSNAQYFLETLNLTTVVISMTCHV